MGKKNKDNDMVRMEIVGSVANTVTGSGTLFKFYDYKLNKDITICCDLGIQQDGTIWENYKSNLETLERLDIESLNCCLISHCHGDHSFLTPALMNRGFKGYYIMTHESACMLPKMLDDALFVHECEIKFLQSKGYKVKPLFTKRNIIDMLDRVYEYDFDNEYEISPNIKLKLLKNKHIFGSCSYQMWFKNKKSNVKSVIFTGDLGNTRLNNPFTYNEQFEQVNCNVIVSEVTYGSPDRVAITKKLREQEVKSIEQYIRYTLFEKGGNVIFPCFSLHRSQILLKLIKDIMSKDEIFDNVQVVLDGRLTNTVTDIYKTTLEGDDKDIFDDLLSWKNLKRVKGFDGTRAVVGDKKPKIILTSQGFMMAGHSVFYAESFISNPKHTFIFTGYAPEGCLADKMKKKEQNTIKINSGIHTFRAETKVYHSFSSHIQYEQLLQLFTGGKVTDSIVMIHGSNLAKECMKKATEDKLMEQCKTTKVIVPKRGQVYKL